MKTQKVVPKKSEYVKIDKSPIDKRRGLFAIKPIPKGEDIIQYGGLKITKKQAEDIADEQFEKGQKNNSNEGHVYIFELNKKYDLDGNKSWNSARLINHSCTPNAETIDRAGEIWITAMSPIKEGEEITYNYGYDIEEFQEHPCYCNSKNCIGYIADEKHWKKLKKISRKEK